jgi:hypothetical protein
VTRRGVIAARAISTVAEYASTGVSCQENVRILFGSQRMTTLRRAGSYRRDGLIERFGTDAALPDLLVVP